MRGERGLTLVELMAAVAIFLGLAGMVMQVLGGGLDLWATGEKTRQHTEQAAVLLDRLANEIRHIVCTDSGDGEPRVKLVCDFVEQDPDGDGLADVRSQRLTFVRRIFEERTHPALRLAGSVSGGTEVYTGGSLEPPLRDEDGNVNPQDALQATEGLVEVSLFTEPENAQKRPEYEGRLVLWRALRSPIGGPDSLFEFARDGEEIARGTPAQSVAENLLHLGFEFLDSSVEDLQSSEAGPLRTWDSTRGILRRGESSEAFRHALGPASLEDPDDDVFPRGIRLIAVVTPPPDQSFRASTLAPVGMGTRGERVDVSNGGFLRRLGPGSHMVRIEHEWVEIAECNGRDILITARGLLGSAAVPHKAGATIQVGYRYQRTVLLPSYREDFNPRPVSREASR